VVLIGKYEVRGEFVWEFQDISMLLTEIRREENKIKAQIKKLAKDKNNMTAIKTLAKGLVQSQRTCDRLYQARAQINSVNTQLKLNYAQMKVSETMNKSGEILKMMGNLVKMRELRENCKNFAKQMMKAGIIEDTMEDAFAQLEDPDMEELADKEVDKVLYEITQGQLGKVEEIKNKNLVKEKEQVRHLRHLRHQCSCI